MIMLMSNYLFGLIIQDLFGLSMIYLNNLNYFNYAYIVLRIKMCFFLLVFNLYLLISILRFLF